jgi:hypothetical protein
MQGVRCTISNLGTGRKARGRFHSSTALSLGKYPLAFIADEAWCLRTELGTMKKRKSLPIRWNVAGSTPDEVAGCFHWPNHSNRTMGLGLTQSLTEMSTRNLPGRKERSARKVDLMAICESAAQKIVEVSTSRLRPLRPVAAITLRFYILGVTPNLQSPST